MPNLILFVRHGMLNSHLHSLKDHYWTCNYESEFRKVLLGVSLKILQVILNSYDGRIWWRLVKMIRQWWQMSGTADTGWQNPQPTTGFLVLGGEQSALSVRMWDRKGDTRASRLCEDFNAIAAPLTQLWDRTASCLGSGLRWQSLAATGWHWVIAGVLHLQRFFPMTVNE